MILNLRSKTRFLPKLAFLTARLRWRNRVSGARVLSVLTKLVDGFSCVLTVERPMGPSCLIELGSRLSAWEYLLYCYRYVALRVRSHFFKTDFKKECNCRPVLQTHIESVIPNSLIYNPSTLALAPKSKIKNGITYFNEFSSHQPGNPNEILWEQLCCAFYSDLRCSRSCPVK